MDPAANPAFIIFSALMPLLIALVKQSGWSSSANALIALGAYIVVGALAAVMSGEPVTAENAVSLIATATVVGSAAYQLVWRNLGAGPNGSGSLDDRLTEATSIVRG